MSIRIRIEKAPSEHSKKKKDAQLDETVSENMKINIPRTNNVKRNNLNEINNIVKGVVKNENVKEQKSIVFSENNTIREILKYNLNTTIQTEKDKIEMINVNKNVSEKVNNTTSSNKMDDFSRILNESNQHKYKYIFPENQSNFVFKNYIEKERFNEEELRERNNLMMNKGFITDHSISLRVDYSISKNDQSSITEDKMNRINNISRKIQKMTDCKKNLESHSTFSVNSISTSSNKEVNNKCACFGWNK